MRRFYRFCQLCKHGICNQNISINDNFDNVPSANIGPTLFIDTNLLLGERNSKSACIISARFSQLNNQTSNQLFKCNFGFAFRSSLVIIDKENVNLITYL